VAALDEKEQVRAHWEREPCGTSTASSVPGTPEFFAEVEQERYRLEPYIPGFAQFERWEGRRILEVGVGLGTDFVRFVRAGADAVGVDLTEAAVEAVRRRLSQEGLAAEVLVADAEALPFEDASFDLVYSYGVLHHTPDTGRALAEARRVLRPGGEARIMLYSRRSWLALGAWARWGLGRGRPWRSISRVLAEHLESPGTKAYTLPELDRLFAGFGSVEYVRHVTPYDRRVAGPIAGLTGPRFGWFIGVVARP
jgi:SAM-dependent methyltransferase